MRGKKRMQVQMTNRDLRVPREIHGGTFGNESLLKKTTAERQLQRLRKRKESTSSTTAQQSRRMDASTQTIVVQNITINDKIVTTTGIIIIILLLNNNKIKTEFHVVDKEFPIPRDGILGHHFLRDPPELERAPSRHPNIFQIKTLRNISIVYIFTTTSIPFYIFQLLERGTLHGILNHHYWYHTSNYFGKLRDRMS
ncbi:hypothetical protein AGLY_006362 [Aphis glycines]|uniref:Uncharacterized protein n=1 Tax=Aphis glycines TaxID=307491 RepID=A0A6G0TRQ9_APHGL|nr:hypothetical protein AGLY_006362 [Aphis glycines]